MSAFFRPFWTSSRIVLRITPPHSSSHSIEYGKAPKTQLFQILLMWVLKTNKNYVTLQLGPNQVCMILSHRRDTITSVRYFVSMELYKVSHLRDSIMEMWHFLYYRYSNFQKKYKKNCSKDNLKWIFRTYTLWVAGGKREHICQIFFSVFKFVSNEVSHRHDT